MTMVVAAGPFTASEDLAFEPLRALLGCCREAPPDVLLLVGPFVDAEHPLIKGGLAEQSFEEIHEAGVRSERPGSQPGPLRSRARGAAAEPPSGCARQSPQRPGRPAAWAEARHRPPRPTQVLAQLVEYAAGPGARTRLLLMPSARDVHHDAVFPQPALPADLLGAEVLGLPNPCTFRRVRRCPPTGSACSRGLRTGVPLAAYCHLQ